MTQADEWAERHARTVAAEVRRHRQRLGLSAQQLADACAELGMPLSRSLLANLESGRRTAVSTAELVILGTALGVPPVTLLFPVGYAETVEVLPGRDAAPWVAARWFAGEAYSDVLPRPRFNPPELWRAWVQELAYAAGIRSSVEAAAAERDRTEAEAHALRRQLEADGMPSAEAARQADLVRARARAGYDSVAHALAVVEDRIRDLHSMIRKAGLIPPSLQPDLADIDTTDQPDSEDNTDEDRD